MSQLFSFQFLSSFTDSIMAAVSERVDSLEQTLQDFIRNADVQFTRLFNSQLQTEVELRLFKDEMGAFKDEMRVFKDEMRDYKDETRRQYREMNKKWGEISNKLSTLVGTWSPRVYLASLRNG